MVEKGNNEKWNEVAAQANNQHSKVGQNHSNISKGFNRKNIEKTGSSITLPEVSSNIALSAVDSSITSSEYCNTEHIKEASTCPICDTQVDSDENAVECDAWLHYSCEKLPIETIYEIEHNLTF